MNKSSLKSNFLLLFFLFFSINKQHIICNPNINIILEFFKSYFYNVPSLIFNQFDYIFNEDNYTYDILFVKKEPTILKKLINDNSEEYYFQNGGLFIGVMNFKELTLPLVSQPICKKNIEFGFYLENKNLLETTNKSLANEDEVLNKFYPDIEFLNKKKKSIRFLEKFVLKIAFNLTICSYQKDTSEKKIFNQICNNLLPFPIFIPYSKLNFNFNLDFYISLLYFLPINIIEDFIQIGLEYKYFIFDGNLNGLYISFNIRIKQNTSNTKQQRISLFINTMKKIEEEKKQSKIENIFI